MAQVQDLSCADWEVLEQQNKKRRLSEEETKPVTPFPIALCGECGQIVDLTTDPAPKPAWELSIAQLLELRKDPKMALRLLTQAMVIRALTDEAYVENSDLGEDGVQVLLPPNTDVEEMKKVMLPLYGDVLFFTEGKTPNLSVTVPDLKDAKDFYTSS